MSKFLDQQGLQVLWEKVREHDALRNNDYNYEANFIPYKGQICFVDTARNGLQVKIGDGVTKWSELEYFSNLANENTEGLMKLYKTLGQNEDGTITQKKITDEFSTRYKTAINSNEECLIFSL